MMNGQVQYPMKTQIGLLYLTASLEGLTGISFSRRDIPTRTRLDVSKSAQKILRDTFRQLKEYFGGKRQIFDLALYFEATAFEKKVWQALSEIPFGQTASYGDIAKKIRNPNAVRSVGSANGKNPFCIVIPCHRVISSDGTLGGYSGGLKFKRELLKHEGVQLK